MTEDKHDAPIIGHVISHAHWDREWRYPIWQTRWNLERMFAQLLDLLDGGNDYHAFVTDSQVVMLDDYLQVRPEDRGRIVEHVRAGRLQIGPWYTLPEFYPLDGECLVRNLLRGRRAADQYGGVLDVAYTTFGWGQPSQLPQIYAEFGLRVALGGKHIDPARTSHNEFIWEGLDGTQMLASRLGPQGRANFYKYAVIPIVFGRENIGPDWRFAWDDQGLVFHRAEAERAWTDYQRRYRQEQDRFEPARVPAAVEQAWQTTEGTTVPGHRALFDGGDFTFAQPLLGAIIAEANRRDPDRQLRHSRLTDYVAALEAGIDRAQLPVIRGELRDGPEPSVTPNALAFRSDLKRRNRQVQRALLQVAEPWAVVARLLGGPDSTRYLELAWDYLFKTHCHDSIHGVVQDKTARDTAYRTEQSHELAEVVTDASLQHLARCITCPAEDALIHLIVFNPLPFARRVVARATVDTPIEWQARRLEMIDPQGHPVPTELLSVEPVKTAVNEDDSRPWPYHAHRHEIEFDAGAVPALGYRAFAVKVKETMDPQQASWPTPPTRGKSLLAGPGVLENDHLRLQLNANGTFDLFDKQTQRWYRSLHHFEDSGDSGDGWVRFTPTPDRCHTSLTGAVANWIAADTPLGATLVTEVTMDLPVASDKPVAEFDLYASRRSQTTRPLVIRSEITLARHARRVDIRTCLHNTVSHHRLRVMFPTDLSQARWAHAEGHFCVERRPIEPTPDAEGRYRPGMHTQPQQYFVDVSHDTGGLAILNDGLLEYEVTPDPSRTIALSLLRSVKMRICTEPRVGAVFPGQTSWAAFGPHEFRYSVLPHAGDWAAADVFAEARDFAVPCQLVQCNAHRFGHQGREGSFLNIDPPLVQLSGLKPAEHGAGYVVRLYNPSSEPLTCTLHWRLPIDKLWRVTMSEQRLAELPHQNGRATVELGPCKVVTLEMTTASAAARPRA